MKNIRFICINNTDDNIIVTTSMTALAKFIGVNNSTLYRVNITNQHITKYKHFIVYFDTTITKMKRYNNKL